MLTVRVHGGEFITSTAAFKKVEIINGEVVVDGEHCCWANPMYRITIEQVEPNDEVLVRVEQP